MAPRATLVTEKLATVTEGEMERYGPQTCCWQTEVERNNISRGFGRMGGWGGGGVEEQKSMI